MLRAVPVNPSRSHFIPAVVREDRTSKIKAKSENNEELSSFAKPSFDDQRSGRISDTP
jgi:hypothetical protein